MFPESYPTVNGYPFPNKTTNKLYNFNHYLYALKSEKSIYVVSIKIDFCHLALLS